MSIEIVVDIEWTMIVGKFGKPLLLRSINSQIFNFAPYVLKLSI